MEGVRDPKDLPGMKARDLSKCLTCGRGVMHGGTPWFYRIRMESMAADVAAIQRQHGLELAHGPVASVLGPDEDVAKVLGQTGGLVCSQCIELPIACLIASAGD